MKSPLYEAEREKSLKELIAEMSAEIEEDDSNAFLYFARALQYYQLSQQYYDISELFIVGDEELYYKYVNCAYNDVDKALSLDDEIDDYAYSFKLFMLKKLKRWEEVLDYGAELIETVGIDNSYYALLGEAAFNLQEWEICIDIYSEIIDTADDEDIKHLSLRIFLERGLSYFSLKKYDLALKDFFKHKDFSIKNPFEINVDELIAKSYSALEQYEKAIEYFSYAIDDDPEDSDLYFNRGRIYCDYLQKFEIAVKDFKKAVKYAEKHNYFYYHNLGYASVWQGQIEEGKNNYQKALDYYDNAIWAYNKATKDKKVREYTAGYALHLKNELLKKLN